MRHSTICTLRTGVKDVCLDCVPRRKNVVSTYLAKLVIFSLIILYYGKSRVTVLRSVVLITIYSKHGLSDQIYKINVNCDKLFYA